MWDEGVMKRGLGRSHYTSVACEDGCHVRQGCACSSPAAASAGAAWERCLFLGAFGHK